MKRVEIIYGGASNEKEISYLTAKSIYEHIDTDLYNSGLTDLSKFDPDNFDNETIFFIAVHGEGGEDGKIQTLLENKKRKFTGSSSESCILTWDKVATKRALIANDILTPQFKSIKNNEHFDFNDSFFTENEHYFVKPNFNGSSYGISKVSDKKFNEALKEAKKYSTEVIIEKSFNGPEYTVALLKGKPLTPLQILHDPIRGFYDYEAKYNSQNTQKIKIEDESIVKRLKEISEKVFDCLNCKTWARVDFVSEGEKLAVIEINSVPGFTAKSLFPLAAKYSGIEYKELISLIIEDC
ncbi:ATP-grasp domain-containing protein [bacterium]|jgi:D-alanine-D-alanine ligase|nr:ATP-grasp domain-containing protein [bacterium]